MLGEDRGVKYVSVHPLVDVDSKEKTLRLHTSEADWRLFCLHYPLAHLYVFVHCKISSPVTGICNTLF